MTGLYHDDAGAEDALRQAQVAFVGRIVAASTHKFHNHLAVIKEYSGLIGDLLGSGQPDIEKVISRCNDITGNIIERADQAAAMEEALNRFVHRGDVAATLFNVGKAAEELFLLYRICASRRRINFVTDVAEGAPDVINSPSLFQYALYALTAGYLETLEEDGTIALEITAVDGEAVRVGMRVSGSIDDSAEREMDEGPLKLALAKLQAEFTGPVRQDGSLEAALVISSLMQG